MQEAILYEVNPAKLRLTKKKIHEIVAALAGQEAVPIVEFIGDNVRVSEFQIAEELGLEIARVRQILYRLHNYGLAVYRRKKDRKKGWYISYWTFRKQDIKPTLEKLRADKLDHFRQRLEREERNRGNFYLCPAGCVRLDFDDGVENEFKCPECGQLLNQQDNERTIEFLREKIALLEMHD